MDRLAVIYKNDCARKSDVRNRRTLLAVPACSPHRVQQGLSLPAMRTKQDRPTIFQVPAPTRSHLPRLPAPHPRAIFLSSARGDRNPRIQTDRTRKRWRLSRSPSRQHHSNALAPATSRIRRASARLIQQRLTRTDELLRLLLVDRQPAELRSLQRRLDLRSQCITLRGP
jgi:hypothetical protein